MQQQANKARRDIEFEVGELVLVKLQPYRQQSLARRWCHKLSVRYFGPYRIMEKIGKVAYRLALPARSKICPVFHISLLKKWIGTMPAVVLELPPDSVQTHPILVPVAIVASRVCLENGRPVQQVLIQWDKATAEENSWEKFDDIKKLFPGLHLEGKVIFEGEGDDRNATFPIWLAQGGEVMKKKMNREAGRVAMGEAEDEVQRREFVRRKSTREARAPHWMKDFATGTNGSATRG